MAENTQCVLNLLSSTISHQNMAVIGFLSQMIIYIGRNIVKAAVFSGKELVLSTLVAPGLTSTSAEGKRSCIVLIIFAVTID